MSHLTPAISQPIHFLNTVIYKDAAALRKKALEYAEDTRAMLLEGVIRKEPTKPIDRRLVASSFEPSEPFQLKKSQGKISEPEVINKSKDPHRFEITKPRSVLPRIVNSNQTLTGTTESLEVNDDEVGKRRLTQSFYELNKTHCDSLQSTLDGTEPDISLSMDRCRQPSNEKTHLPVLRSSVFFYTSSQKTPVVLPNLDSITSWEKKNVDYQILAPELQEFNGNKYSFYKDFGRLAEYESVHQKNLISLVTRDLDTIHTDNVGSISDDELLQMIHNLLIHIGEKIMVNGEITTELLGVYEKEMGPHSTNQRELAIQLKLCIKKLSRTELIPLKAIIGHIRRIAIVYGFYKSIRAISSIFSEMIFTTENSKEELLNASPIELYEIIFNRHGPQTQLSALLEFMLFHYNIFF